MTVSIHAMDLVGGVAIPVMSTEDDLRGSHMVGELFDIVGAVLVGILRRIFGGILFSQLVAIAISIAFSSFFHPIVDLLSFRIPSSLVQSPAVPSHAAWGSGTASPLTNPGIHESNTCQRPIPHKPVIIREKQTRKMVPRICPDSG